MTAATVAMAAPGVTRTSWPGGSGGLAAPRRDVDRVAVDRQVDLVRDGRALLLGQLTEQPRGPGEQRETAQQLQRQAEVGEHGAAGARAVQRQRPAQNLRVDPADRLEQPQVRAVQALL